LKNPVVLVVRTCDNVLSMTESFVVVCVDNQYFLHCHSAKAQAQSTKLNSQKPYQTVFFLLETFLVIMLSPRAQKLHNTHSRFDTTKMNRTTKFEEMGGFMSDGFDFYHRFVFS